MKNYAFILLFFLSSCDFIGKVADSAINKTKDDLSYKSVTGRIGTVSVTVAGQLKQFKNATIKYSETNSSTLLIHTEAGKDVYIQGPAIVEFND